MHKAGMGPARKPQTQEKTTNTLTKRPQDQTETGGNRPDWIAKSPRQIGRKERLERVGAAWNRAEDDGICLRLHGTQIVTEDIYLYPYESAETE